MRVKVLNLNGCPSMLCEFDSRIGRRPPKFLLAADLNADGLISSLWVVASSNKLSGIASMARQS